MSLSSLSALQEFKDVIAGKKSPPATIVLFCSQTQTYIAYGGEVQPLSVPLPPITPAALEAFIHRFGTAPSSWTSSSSSARFSSSSPSDVPLASLLSLASKLRRYLSGKDVVVVVPLSISLRRSSSSLSSRPAMPTPAHAVEGTESRLPLVSVAGSLSQGSPTSPTASLSVLSPSQHYLDYLVVFLMHPLIQVASLVVVSDVMATAIAGGCTQGVLVLHASLHCCTIGYVMDGCTTRFSACPWEEVLAGDWWEQKSGETVEEAERNWWRMRRSTTTNAWPSIEDASNEEEADANQRVDLPTATEVPGGSTRIGMGNIILEREGAGVNTVYASIRGTPSTIHEQDHGKRVFPFPTPPCIAKLTSLFGLAPIERVLGGEEGKPKNTDDFFSSSEGSSSSLIAATVPGSISQTSTTPLLGKLPLLLARLYQSYMSHQVIIVGDVLGRKGMLLLALLQAMLKAHAPGRLPSILQESHPSFASPSRSSPPPLRENSPTTPPLAPGTDRTAMNSHRSGSDNSVASHPRCNHGRTGEARDGKEEEHTEVAQQGSSTLAKKRGSKPQLSRGLDFKQGSIDSPKTKKQKMEEEEEEEEEASSERSKSSSSEEDGDTSMSSSSSLEETNTPTSWRVLPTCPPHAPWWMPLIGGSIIAQLPERDVRGMRISPSEIVETNGKIVYWKALL